MSKPTPGPWVAREIKGGAPQSKFIIETPESVVGPESVPRWIAEVHGIDMKYQERGQTVANARLIAAAPELLEALKAARETLKSQYVEREERGHIHKWKFGEAGTVSGVIDAAIAKAEGRDE